MLSASKRLQKEAQVLKNSANDDVRLNPTANIMEWDATIVGPKDSFYDGYEFDLKIQVPSAYPMQPPVIKFATKIFHPNVMYEVCPTMSIVAMRHISIQILISHFIELDGRDLPWYIKKGMVAGMELAVRVPCDCRHFVWPSSW